MMPGWFPEDFLLGFIIYPLNSQGPTGLGPIA